MKDATFDKFDLPRFNIGDTVYTIIVYQKTGAIAKGRVVAAHAMDEINSRYLVQGVNFSVWCYDREVFRSKEELLQCFASVVIE